MNGSINDIEVDVSCGDEISVSSPPPFSQKNGGDCDASPEEQSPEYIAYLTSPQRAFHFQRQTQTLQERRQLKVQRNQEALERLLYHNESGNSSNLVNKDYPIREKVSQNNTTSLPPRENVYQQVDTVMPKKTSIRQKAPLKDQVENLQEKFPFRTNQIQLLFQLLHSTVLQQQDQQQHEDLFVPPAPIFCLGSGGTGKTSVVKGVVKLLATCSNSPVTVIPAFVDCGLLGNESYTSSTMDSSVGTNKSQILQSVWKDILYEVYYSMMGTQSSQVAATNDILSASGVGEDYDSDGEIQDEELVDTDEGLIEEERKGYGQAETTGTRLSLRKDTNLPQKGMNIQVSGNVDEDTDHEEKIERLTLAKVTKSRSAAQRRVALKGIGLPPLLQIPLLASNLSRYTTGLPGAFAKALVNICGPASKRRNLVVLVLDRAECLLGLVSWFSQNDRNAMLSQLLLLPQYYKLSLCVIVVSSHGLLQYARIHNTQEPTEFIGTLSELVNPIRVYFDNYKGHDMFETVRRGNKLFRAQIHICLFTSVRRLT